MAEGETLRKDLGAGPNDLNLIETNLWLGNLAAATDKRILEENNIKYIITVNSFPLPKEITDLSYLTTKFIKAFDTSRDDLLSNFEDIYQFIEQSVKKGAVLVHCYLGVSRSATILLSYIMKKKNMTLNAALRDVKSKRECIDPNPGFLAQLKLYEIMHWTLDRTNVQYKMFRLYITAHHVKNENYIPESYIDIIKADPILVKTSVDPIVFKCRKCRRLLARGSNIIPHASKEKYSWRDSRWSEGLEKTEICQRTYFIEPLIWMENVSDSLEGKLHCPNADCKNKLGSFSWVMGCQCPCSSHICPGFCLIPSKVDKQYLIKGHSNLFAFFHLENYKLCLIQDIKELSNFKNKNLVSLKWTFCQIKLLACSSDLEDVPSRYYISTSMALGFPTADLGKKE